MLVLVIWFVYKIFTKHPSAILDLDILTKFTAQYWFLTFESNGQFPLGNNYIEALGTSSSGYWNNDVDLPELLSPFVRQS